MRQFQKIQSFKFAHTLFANSFIDYQINKIMKNKQIQSKKFLTAQNKI